MTPKLIVIIAVSLLLTVGWLFFLFFPTSAKQANLQAEVTAAQTQLQDYEATLAQLPVYIQTRADLQKRLQKANSNLYARKDLELLFNELERTAKAHSLRMVEITPPVSELLALNRTVPSDGEPQFLTLNIVLRGNYLDFGQYVEQLERAPYFRSVQGCVISKLQDGSDQVTYSLGFKALLGMTMEEVS